MILDDEKFEKIRAISFWNRKSIKQIVDEALGEYLKGKRVRELPKKKS